VEEQAVTQSETLLLILMLCWIGVAWTYRKLLVDAEKRIVHLQHLLDDCRRSEQRYQAALMKARTP
jgi:hypothetical protein